MINFWRSRVSRAGAIHATMVVFAVLTFYPFVFMLITSIKSIPQFYHSFWGITTPLHWDNYASAFLVIHRYILNSVLVSATTALGVVTLGCISGYIFARFVFPLKQVLFFMILGVMMVPAVLTLVPAYEVVSALELLNTPAVLILPYMAGGQVLAIFLLRSFFEMIPRDLFDSATVDGAGHLRVMRTIVVPLSKPILGVVVIMDVLATWNGFVWPYVTLNDARWFVLPVGLFSFAGQYGSRYGEMFAGYTIAAIPLIVLFAFTTRTFLRGITTGALKV
jgi:ABC-type glycerol-3-phosphate transport system permease component